MSALICIPTYNERENIALLIPAIFENSPADTHVLVIDDNSPDGTGKLADQLSQENNRVHVLHRSEKQGLAAAYLAGFQWGIEKGYDWLFEMDADFSHQPQYLKSFFEAISSQQYDALCGSRYIKGGGVSNWDRSRLLLSRSASIYARIILGYPINDWTGGFNAWKKETLLSIGLTTIQSRGYVFQVELKYRCLKNNFKLLEIPIVFQERRAGHSKMSGSIVSEALMGVIKLKFRSV
jgi:dolichol-phosphate mannosyltransferase